MITPAAPSLRKTYTFTGETGRYTLETRLNGSRSDIRQVESYYFTKGKEYSINGVLSVSSDKLTWKVSQFLLSEEIPSSTISYGAKATKPSTKLYKPLFTVGEKWYTDYARTKEFDFNTSVTKDITL